MTPYGLKHFEKNSHGNDKHELIHPKYEAAHVWVRIVLTRPFS